MKTSELRATATTAEHLLKLLANRHRLMVLCELHGGEHSVGELRDEIGLSQSALSQHLARLRADGLVKTRREQQTIRYALANAEVGRIIALLHEMFCSSGGVAGTCSGKDTDHDL